MSCPESSSWSEPETLVSETEVEDQGPAASPEDSGKFPEPSVRCSDPERCGGESWRIPAEGGRDAAQTVERREVGRHGPVGGGWTGPLITVDVKPKSTVCRRELKQNQANSDRRPVPLPAEQPAGDRGSSWVTDAALEAAVNVISGAGVQSREFKQDGVTVSSNHVSLCISVSIIFQEKLIMSPL